LTKVDICGHGEGVKDPRILWTDFTDGPLHYVSKKLSTDVKMISL